MLVLEPCIFERLRDVALIQLTTAESLCHTMPNSDTDAEKKVGKSVTSCWTACYNVQPQLALDSLKPQTLLFCSRRH